MRNILVCLLLLITLVGCEVETASYPYPCENGNCESEFTIDTLVSPGSYLGADGYWRVKFSELNYFTIQGRTDELVDRYVLNNTPLIETQFDSDYWVIFDTLSWTSPMYSVLSWFSDKEYQNPIAIGNITYTLEDIADLHPPLNIVGYQIPKHFCFDCPYAPSLLASYSKYNYSPRQQIFCDDEMIGDTASIFIKTIFNTDVGMSIENEHEIKVIFE